MKADRIIERLPILRQLQRVSDRLSTRPNLVAITTITLLVGLYFVPVISQPGKMFFGIDIVGQVYVYENYVVDSIGSGSLPHWNPYLFCGYPALAQPQYLVFYPPQMLLRLFLPPHQSISWAIILHAWIAGLGMYALGRRLKLHPWIALACGVAFAFNGALILRVYAGHVWFVYALAWVPLAWLLITIAIEDRHLIATIGAGATIALIILTGHPTVPAYALVFLSLCGGFLSVKAGLEAGSWRRFLGSLSRLAAILALGMALSAVQIIPTAVLASHTTLSGGYDLEQANIFALSLKSLVTFVVPGIQFVSGLWEWVTYVGIMIMLAVPFAFMGKDAKLLAWFLAFVVIFAFWLALGKSAGLYTLLYRLIPPFRILRIPPRALVMAAPALIVLGGLGFQSLFEGRPTARQIERSTYVYGNSILLGVGALAGFMLAWRAELPLLASSQLLARLSILLAYLVIAGAILLPLNRFSGWLVRAASFVVGVLAGGSTHYALGNAVQQVPTAFGIIAACFSIGMGIALIYALRLVEVSEAAMVL
ncbi:MAG: hypothetical protein P8Z40_00615, partial [Chloroflexota bacterium]